MSASANPLLPDEQRELWRRLNDTAVDLPQMTVAELLLDQVRAGPDRAAVLASRRSLSHRGLAGAAAAVAARLDRADAAVLICVEPGWEQAVAVFAALLAGIPFHAVHPGLAQSARWSRAAKLAARMVLTQSWLADRMEWPPGTSLLAVDEVPTGSPDVPSPENLAAPGDVACVLAPTELGGELRPVLNGALVDTLTDLAVRFDLGPDDRVLAVTPLGDEVALTALLGMLGVGGAVVVPDDIDLWTPAMWLTLMHRDDVTVWHSSPSLAVLLAEHLAGRGDGLPRGLRVVLLGGEPLAGSLMDRLRRAAGRPLRAGYLGVPGSPGLWSSCLEVPIGSEPGHLPVGAPLRNRELHVLGEGGAPCPVWVSGRVHVGGRCPPVEPGGATIGADGRPLWRTDLTGRLLPDGTIEVLGEDSARITVHGHPVQLREVEGRLLEHDAVLAAAVVPAAEGSRAYVRVAPGETVSGAALLEHLRARMSPYLLPSEVELVNRFALRPDGRTDRAALRSAPVNRPDPIAGTTVDQAAVPTAIVDRACAVAARILDLSDVEPTMNLLDVGASSVQLVRIAVAVEDELGIAVDVEELLRFPSIAVLVSSAPPVPAPPAGDAAPAGELAREPQAPPSRVPIRDPLERLAFKDRRPGVRDDLPAEGVELVGAAATRRRLARRRTYRAFGAASVPAARLGELLDVLCEVQSTEAAPRHAYPSAGSLYPVQTYLAVRRDRVDGLSAGTYYLHPGVRRLLPLERGWEVPAAAHGWINREADATSAFSVHLVARLDAIAPMYGDRSRDYCVFEAGAMCQLVMSVAAELDLALCPVGEMDDAVLREPLRLSAGDEPLHALLGGPPPGPGEGIDPAERDADMVRRIGDVAFESLLGRPR